MPYLYNLSSCIILIDIFPDMYANIIFLTEMIKHKLYLIGDKIIMYTYEYIIHILQQNLKDTSQNIRDLTNN